MSQDWSTNVVDWSGVTAQTTMNNIELMLATLRSNFSGSSAPANLVAGNFWFNTATGHEGMRIRNADDDAWLKILEGDASSKVWFYRNDTCEGWVVDTSVTDRVLSIKGGSNAYNVNGGNTAGTWTQPDHVHDMNSHTHSMGSHTHDLADGGDSSYAPGEAIVKSAGSGNMHIGAGGGSGYKKAAYTTGAPSSVNTATPSISDTLGAATAITWRPAAAVGTLQYPDLT